MIGERQCLLYVLLHQQDSRPSGRPGGGENAVDLRHQARRQTRRGFVDEQQRWRRHQLAGNREHATLATRKGARNSAALVAERREEGINLLELAGEARAVAAEDPRPHLQVLLYGEE